jgi:hypothetical protein
MHRITILILICMDTCKPFFCAVSRTFMHLGPGLHSSWRIHVHFYVLSIPDNSDTTACPNLKTDPARSWSTCSTGCPSHLLHGTSAAGPGRVARTHGRGDRRGRPRSVACTRGSGTWRSPGGSWLGLPNSY